MVNVRVPSDSLLGKGVVKATVFDNGTFKPICGMRNGDSTEFRFDADGEDVEFAGAGELKVTFSDKPPGKSKEKK